MELIRIRGLGIPTSLSPVSVSTVKAVGMLKDLVCECEDLYPGIDVWFKRKVETPLMKVGNRIGYMVMDGDELVAGMILKTSRYGTKICTMRVKDSHQNQGIGTNLFGIAVGEACAKGFPSHVYFTAPESLVVDAKDYFERMGFESQGVLRARMYRRDGDEFIFVKRIGRAYGKFNERHDADEGWSAD